MKTAIGHIRANAVAYLALFVALGGTGYAAMRIPAGSVGTRQLRNGAVTPAKLDRHSIAGYVAFWARIDSSGHVVASSKPATTDGWGFAGIGSITFRGVLPTNCLALADVTNGQATGGGSVTDTESGSFGGKTTLTVLMRNVSGAVASEPIVVADICP